MKRHASVSNKAEKMLNRICKKILKEPRQLVMAWVFATKNDLGCFGRTWPIPNCKTAACIAGWGISLSKKKKPSKLRGRYTAHNFIEPGRKAIGLTGDQAGALFYDSNWPSCLGSDYRLAESKGQHKRKAQIAVKRIQHFIQTGE